MSEIVAAIEPIWKVLVAGLVLGAGLPALFATGVHFGAAQTHPDGSVTKASLGGKAIAALCFAVVLAAVAIGLALLVDAKGVLGLVGLESAK